ncbi:hypothetical protein [Qipengyuania sp. JC766]|uniref:hypothetical protein n=1 Tax=Qipengyuania sp. JC766 TaxID=3232139 RepID=UPI00345A4AB3
MGLRTLANHGFRLELAKLESTRIFASLVLGASTLAASAQAQEVSFVLNAEVDSICEATTDAGENIEIDLGVLSETPTGSEVSNDQDVEIVYVCNDADGFTRTIASLNDGVLVRVGSTGGDGNEIPYFLEAIGSNGLDFSRIQVTQPLTRTFGASTDFLNGVAGTLTVYVNGVLDQGGDSGDPASRTTVFAGQYTDVLTLTVTAN